MSTCPQAVTVLSAAGRVYIAEGDRPGAPPPPPPKGPYAPARQSSSAPPPPGRAAPYAAAEQGSPPPPPAPYYAFDAPAVQAAQQSQLPTADTADASALPAYGPSGNTYNAVVYTCIAVMTAASFCAVCLGCAWLQAPSCCCSAALCCCVHQGLILLGVPVLRESTPDMQRPG